MEVYIRFLCHPLISFFLSPINDISFLKINENLYECQNVFVENEYLNVNIRIIKTT